MATPLFKPIKLVQYTEREERKNIHRQNEVATRARVYREWRCIKSPMIRLVSSSLPPISTLGNPRLWLCIHMHTYTHTQRDRQQRPKSILRENSRSIVQQTTELDYSIARSPPAFLGRIMTLCLPLSFSLRPPSLSPALSARFSREAVGPLSYISVLLYVDEIRTMGRWYQCARTLPRGRSFEKLKLRQWGLVYCQGCQKGEKARVERLAY